MMIRFLAICRYMLVVPVIGCALLTAGVVLMGVGRIATSGYALLEKGDFSAKAAKMMSLAVIEIIDLFLIGIVAYITAVGIYKLFIGNVDAQLPIRLKINNLKDLEDKIIGIIVAALAVAFLGHAAVDEPSALLNYGGGIALVIIALGFFINYGNKNSAPADKK
jgi:uncharacterized membrane protein YqhA